jgi:hypothetical protein
MTRTRVIAAVILGMSAIDSLLGLICVQAAQRTYPYAIPFAVMVFLGLLAGITAVCTSYRWAVLAQGTLVLISCVLFVFAVANWSHGDDGPRMILVGGIGPTLLIAAVVSIASMLLIMFDPYGGEL